MTIYEAPLPWNLSTEDLDRLRGLGAVKFTFEIEAPSRTDAIREIAGEMEGYHATLGSRDWWDDNFSGRRARAGEETK